MTTKRTISISSALIVFGLAGFVLLSIFFKEGKNPGEPTQPTNAGKPINLRLGHNLNPESAMHWAAEQFAERVHKKSDGKISISVYPQQQLGTDQQMMEMAMDGELDIILTPTAKLSVYVPAMQLIDLPFLFPNRQVAYEILDGKPGQMLLKKLEEFDLKGVTFWENGFKQFTAGKPIHTPQDFQGRNIRIMKSRIISDQFRALGANPIPIDFHKTYQALKDGSVDGQENPLVAIVGMKFHEVQSNLTISNHAFLGYVLSFSKKRLDTLPPGIQKIMVDVARELTPLQRQKTQEKEQGFLETIRESGCTITKLTKAEKKSFRNEMSFLIDKYSDSIGPDILMEVRKILNKHRSTKQTNKDLAKGNPVLLFCLRSPRLPMRTILPEYRQKPSGRPPPSTGRPFVKHWNRLIFMRAWSSRILHPSRLSGMKG